MIDTVKKVHEDVKKWGLPEWGSLASIIGVSLWIYDNSIRKHFKALK